MTVVLRVESPGPLTLVQDLGRRGVAHLGVARSGAADRASLRLANRLVGNAEGSAGLEALAGGLVLTAAADTVLAVTGAACGVTVDGRQQGRNAALVVRAGQVLALGPTVVGVRAYVGVRGGVDVVPVLGSRSYDQLGDLGPPPLRAGALVAAGDGVVAPPVWEAVAAADPAAGPVLRLLRGPRTDWLDGGLAALAEGSWTVAQDADRTGVRLDGQALRRRTGDLPSEGTVVGGVQLPADGRPILLGPDAGVTGGYPMVAVVADADVDAVGQLAPGTTVRFRAG